MTGFLLTAKQKLMLCINKRLYRCDRRHGRHRSYRPHWPHRRDGCYGRHRTNHNKKTAIYTLFMRNTSLSLYRTSAAQVETTGGVFRCEAERRTIPLASGQHGAVDKVPDYLLRAENSSKNSSKKDAHRRHPIHLIILFKFKAVAERRQWSSAASKPRRKTRVKLCPHFWAANVPSHQICRLRSASR